MNLSDHPAFTWFACALKRLGQRMLCVCVGVPLLVLAVYFVISQAFRLLGWMDPVTIIEPIQIPKSFKDLGYSDAMLQHALVDKLNQIREDAKGVTPAEDTEKILTDFKLPDFSMPGMDVSVRPLIEFMRSILKLDSTIYGSVIGTPQHFSVVLTLRAPDGRTVSLNGNAQSEPSHDKRTVKQRRAKGDTDQRLQRNLEDAAVAILRNQSPLLYAQYLTAQEQKRCLDGIHTCHFEAARDRFEALAAGASAQNDKERDKNAPWAILALSKLDTYDKRFDRTIELASSIVNEAQRNRAWRGAAKWAYYNWGVALNDINCYSQASKMLRMATQQMPDYPAAHNALAHTYMELARNDENANDDTRAFYRQTALDELNTAIYLNPHYQEAYVNRGDLLRQPVSVVKVYVGDFYSWSTEVVSTRSLDDYKAAVALEPDSAYRAYTGLHELNADGYLRPDQKKQIEQPRTQCRSAMARSLLDSWGCGDAAAQPTIGRKTMIRHASLPAEDNAADVCRKEEMRLPASALDNLFGQQPSTTGTPKPEFSRPPGTTARPSSTTARDPIAGAKLG